MTLVIVTHEHCPRADAGKPCTLCPSGQAEARFSHPVAEHCPACWPCGCCMVCNPGPCAGEGPGSVCFSRCSCDAGLGEE